MGGTQFIGKAIARDLIKQGHSVSIFTRGILPVDYTGFEKHFLGNRNDEMSLRQVANEEFDAVVDASAYNEHDILNLLTTLKTEGLKKYLFISSGAVYLPSWEPLTEMDATGKNDVWKEYGQNKLIAENILLQQYSCAGFPVAIVRPPYVYGQGNNLYREAYFFNSVMRGSTMPIPDSRAQVHFLFIEDLVNIISRMLDNDSINGQIFNVALDEPVSWEYLMSAVSDALKVEAKYKKIKYKGFLESRQFFPYRDQSYLLDCSKLKTFGVDEPRIRLSEGLRKAFEWQKEFKPELRDEKMSKISEALLL